MEFKVPSLVPQDLQLILDLVSVPSTSNTRKRASSIASSGNDIDSEDEIEETLVVEEVKKQLDEEAETVSTSSDSSSESDSESDDNEDSADEAKHGRSKLIDEDENDEEGWQPSSSVTEARTKNETIDASVMVPEIKTVDENEILEKVGEIMSILENMVIVKGIASQNENRASERALDSESLLVFEDRQVLGYVHETFGPTYQPLYQVKFSSSDDINPEIVKVSRPVFHIPRRSKFVFPSQLRTIKGSDASNYYDEEVGVDEIEFSDDEAEAAFRKQRERARKERRQSSISSSRFSTPIPSQMRDQEMADDSSFYGASPYDEFGPYDIDATTVAGPSRPAPLPYDDPYQDVAVVDTQREPPSRPHTDESNDYMPSPREGSIRTSRGRRDSQGRGRGRGRGRGSGAPTTGSGTRIPSNRREVGNRRRSESVSGGSSAANFNGGTQAHHPRSLSPTSMAIARATGQLPNGATYSSSQSTPNAQHPAYLNHSFGYADLTPNQPFQPYVQPHINPRFASAFGFNLSYMQQQQQQQHYSPVEHLAGVFSPAVQGPLVPYTAPPYTGSVSGDWSRNVTTPSDPLQREASASRFSTLEGQNFFPERTKEESQ